ncbi:MAG: arginine--tRNA ligase [Saprospiraceae bacterium]|nr:arginine--tRNA ligase [Saprospiraceae bacterium]MCF8249567.1 arginine--tRNA ligase [Saprospiraceae bacterium]MCF8280467.1 arginine--tRNA ligase [Bacteroidales bacterium]MCF8310399.1 arginine--tRNA ligase [Saprospiraceae bacterium]MCF8439777.1 arginine--tRNA ligase [Saprospiraceae bacterium]
MTINEIIQTAVIAAIKELYGETISSEQAAPAVTRKEFEGDFTIVTFPFTRFAKKKPGEIAAELGAHLVKNVPQLDRFNVVQGFLNLVVADSFWTDFLAQIAGNEHFGRLPKNGQKVMIEFCSPNTNKPLHLGHVRNILLGWSCSQICEAAGYEVKKVQVVNDRGIAICKSMLAWQKFAEGATPESTGIKSDHFVGDWYVLFEQKFQEEYRAWQASAAGQRVLGEKRKPEQSDEQFFKDFKNSYFNEHSNLGGEAREMLLRWEAGDPDTKALWQQMNQWVYDGFGATYEALGVSFDRFYYESETYLLGKDIVEQGLASGVFYKKEDGSVWADLTDAKLDHKVVMRSDGTSVYITQDLGTAQMRYKDFGTEKMVYVVADEQNYHFQVLFEILKRLGEPYAAGLHHLSYGMVDLPSGKMKSREGTVVDADDLIAEVIAEAKEASKERGELAELSKENQDDILRKIGLAALKFHIIKVGPQKRMVFDPKESVDLQGQTGPHIQYAYVRIKSVLRKAADLGLEPSAIRPDRMSGQSAIEPQERELIAQLYRLPATVETAAANYDPSEVANYCYDLAKAFHKFFTDLSILKADTEVAKAFRLQLCGAVANALRTGMGLLGIEMPERM